MLSIKMDDGTIYKFNNKEYTDYEIKKDFLVVYYEEQWIGVFSLNHFVSLVCERD